MLDRLESISRLLCIGLGVLLFVQLLNAILHGDPLGRATIPDLPTLPASASETSTNTNSAPVAKAAASVGTNFPSGGETNSSAKTNSVPVVKTAASIGTNSTMVSNAVASVNTNAAPVGGTNAPVKTNAAAIAKTAGPHPRPPGLMRGKKADLPPVVQKRVDRVVESEILAPFIRPMPMALLGIAGEDAFLRAPDGQTGMVKEGADLGAIKLLRIGTNRVLVEENGEKKELTLFAGMGGESLLSPETNSAVKTNAPITKKETH
jgi:hypothetical protein